MPHAPEPAEEDCLGTVPSPPPVFHAEQALLASLLLHPHRLGEVTGISGDSFASAAHAAVFTAVSTLPAPDPAEHTKNTTWLDQVLAAARKQAPGLTAFYLHSLIQSCPWARHAPAYARMVEAEHARRRLRGAAERLVQTAHDSSLPCPVPTTLAQADMLAAVVDDIATRFPPRSGVLPRTPAPPGSSSGYAEAAEEEQLLLASAAGRPAEIDSVRWLVPEDFVRPLHAGLWQCLSAMARRHDPVDPVTVLWEAQQRGLLDDDAKPGEVLRLLADQPDGSVEYWGERILQRSLLATATRAGRHIEAYARDPTASPFQLVVGARRALADLAAVRTRWKRATEPTPPAHTRPVPPARAGPPTATAARSARTTR
ncbi:DnaB-like helicase N-terminal domain-containing protein [Streptomyces sp. NPDC059604]|uniref:DnaB-like helicase N-terminal domain-containing protein n=1 Tax=Streptomyces sp. NPDC059604 TaxID=3346881 RepID=UPI0036919F2D